MTLDEKIEVMQAFERGEEIEFDYCSGTNWNITKKPNWNFGDYDYRIKPKPKQVVVIEKWLAESSFGGYIIIEGTKEYIQDFSNTKVKLLDTYEVTI